MIKKILIALGAALAIFAGFAATQPDDFRVTRSTTIAAPAKVIFDEVNNLQKFNAWSPWAKLDPNAKMEFEGPTQGVGAKMHWAGNMQVGEGSMTTAQVRPDSFIQFNLEMLSPMKASHTAEFNFKPAGANTEVEWVMYGKKDFAAKAIGLIMGCEKMVGDMFDKGLANLKTVAESDAAAAAALTAAPDAQPVDALPVDAQPTGDPLTGESMMQPAVEPSMMDPDQESVQDPAAE